MPKHGLLGWAHKLGSRSIFRYFSLSFPLFFIGGCTTPRFECDGRDWFELGRRDGIRGISSEKKESVPSYCMSEFSPRDEELYRNGWNLGISLFCSEQNGFVIGKENRSARPDVCPELVRDDFVRNYQSGLRHFQLSQALFEIEKELDDLQKELTTSPLPKSKKGELQKRRSFLIQERNERSSELARLNERWPASNPSRID